MTGVHYHLLLNHIPILGTLFGIIVMVLGVIGGNIGFKRLALGTFVIAALFAIPVYLTGEPAEEAVEQLNIKESVIEAHEEAAEIAFWGMMILGILALVTLIWEFLKGLHVKGMSYLVLVLGLLVGGYMGYVGNLGGKIRHSEIRTKAVQDGTNQVSANNHEEEEEE